MNILLGITGSIAATLASKTYEELSKLGNVCVVATENAAEFQPPTNRQYRVLFMPDDKSTMVWTDEDEWATYHRGEPGSVLHIELRKWADVFVIAPLSANTLGKIANGICDNLLTCVALAWDFSKPILVAPAMNTMMFTNPAVQKNLATLKRFGYTVIPPVQKVLACGDNGIGAMADITQIAIAVKRSAQEWMFPLRKCPLIPRRAHPGSFGYRRRFDYHTGVDLYCNNGDAIFSCTDGVVVEVKPFTGPDIGHDWWLPTQAVVIDTGMYFILYGECIPTVKIGDNIATGQLIGHVTPVLPDEKLRDDIPGHSCSMLHLELLRRFPDFTGFCGSNGFMTWDLDMVQPYDLLDPTANLVKAHEAEKSVE